MMRTIINIFIFLYRVIYEKVSTLRAKITFFIYGIECGKRIKVRGNLYIQMNNSGSLKVESDVRINSSFGSNPIASACKTSFCIRGGRMRIGERSGISNSFFVCTKEIIIGKDVMIGSGCQFFDNDFHSLISKYRVGEERNDSLVNKKSIIVEDKVFIGSNSIILKGSRIGEGAIVGAGSVVCGTIPAYEIWAGNPAKFIRKTS